MVTVEEQVQIAQRIARALPGVTRAEWKRWLRNFARYELGRAIWYTELLSAEGVRGPAIPRVNWLIAQAIKSQLGVLKSLKAEEQRAILGYVAWWLEVNARGDSLTRVD